VLEAWMGKGFLMGLPYKRRRVSLVRNLWVYRRLVVLALILGLILWFVWANNTPVTVLLPFRLGTLESTTGLVILLSVMVGSVVTALAMTLALAWRRMAGTHPPRWPGSGLPRTTVPRRRRDSRMPAGRAPERARSRRPVEISSDHGVDFK
jgi:uncharacterized integral membrane protein